MAGYMMGRMMGGGAGFAQQPLFSPKTPTARQTVSSWMPLAVTTVMPPQVKP